MIIYNVKIITMSNTDYENGYVEFTDGIITAVGNMKDLSKNKLTNKDLDGQGFTLYPGFIDAHSHVGVFGNGLGFEGNDSNEITDPITPQMNAIDTINPLDYCFTEAANAGITTVITGVGSANPIGGTMAAIKTHGSKRIENRLVKPIVAIKMALGENPKTSYNDRDESPITRMATAALIREQLNKTKRYISAMENAGEESDLPEYDIKCEALIPLLKKETKVHFHCHRADDIFTAVRIAEEFDLDYVLVHATEGGLIADELGKIKTPCIVGPIICDRSKPELLNLSIETAAKLKKEGIKIAICTDHPVAPIQLLPIAAGLAIKGGLSENEALRAITIDAAEILGISGRVGSIGIGKDADFVLLERPFYDVLSVPIAVFINGGRI